MPQGTLEEKVHEKKFKKIDSKIKQFQLYAWITFNYVSSEILVRSKIYL